MDIIASAQRFFEHRHDAILVIVFGSAVKGGMRFESDIDLAVLFERPLSAAMKQDLIEELAGALGRPVDLVDLRGAHGPLLRQILTTGKRLVCRDTTAYGELIRRSLYEQADFQRSLDFIHHERRKRWIGV
jgi:predicted nucleotidyltransferase